MRSYKCLDKQEYKRNRYKLVPIRDEDMYAIMEWRNDQIYHLRQSELLTSEKQIWYFENTVSPLFNQEFPNQILFSYLEDDICIGYGGLVHINWIDKNAEISFIMETKLEANYFELHWANYLQLLDQVAFKELKLHKIFTYAFDLRPQLYSVIETRGFKKEAVLKEQCLWNGQYIDVIIHSKFNKYLTFRKPQADDVLLYFHWVNDEQVREQSYISNNVSLEDHCQWFMRKLREEESHLYLFMNHENNPVGQIRIEVNAIGKSAIIGLSIDYKYRGNGFAPIMIKDSVDDLLNTYPGLKIKAYIKKTNIGSIRTFQKAGFVFELELEYKEIDSLLFTYQRN